MATGVESRHQSQDFLCEDLHVYGDLTVDGDSDVGGSVVPHGVMYESAPSGGTDIVITTADNWYPWVNATAGPLSGITFSANAAGDRLVMSSAGDYSVSGFWCFNATGSANAGVALYQNNTRNDIIRAVRKVSAAGDTGSQAFGGIITCAVDDYISVKWTADGNGDDITPKFFTLRIHKI